VTTAWNKRKSGDSKEVGTHRWRAGYLTGNNPTDSIPSAGGSALMAFLATPGAIGRAFWQSCGEPAVLVQSPAHILKPFIKQGKPHGN
jgi:hypothetical protein